MTHHQDPPGQFPDFSDLDRLRYYLRIARRYLRPWHLQVYAEDVVISAGDRWSRMADAPPSARFEVIIRSEASTVIRSHSRRRNREERYDAARGNCQNPDDCQRARCELLLSVAREARRLGISLTPIDLEIVQLLMAGLNQAEIRRAMDLSRRQYSGSRDRLRVVLTPILSPSLG